MVVTIVTWCRLASIAGSQLAKAETHRATLRLPVPAIPYGQNMWPVCNRLPVRRLRSRDSPRFRLDQMLTDGPFWQHSGDFRPSPITLIMNTMIYPWQLLVVSLAGWLNRQQQAIVEYLRTENQVLKEKLGTKRILLNDSQRRRLAAKAKVLGRPELDRLRRWVSQRQALHLARSGWQVLSDVSGDSQERGRHRGASAAEKPQFERTSGAIPQIAEGREPLATDHLR